MKHLLNYGVLLLVLVALAGTAAAMLAGALRRTSGHTRSQPTWIVMLERFSRAFGITFQPSHSQGPSSLGRERRQAWPIADRRSIMDRRNGERRCAKFAIEYDRRLRERRQGERRSARVRRGD